MPRLPEVLDRDALPEDKRHIYDYLAGTRGSVRLPFSVILNHPELTYRVAHVGSFIRFESVLPDKIRELAILATAREIDARFEWAAHAPIAAQAGVTEQQLKAIASRTAPAGFSDKDALPIKFALELRRENQVTDTTFNAAVAAYGEAGAVELITTVGYYSMLGAILNGLEIEPAADAPQLPR